MCALMCYLRLKDWFVLTEACSVLGMDD
uniref:Uncharacterized protein n=1 Tax=Anguilla anguilla TaxID=7936 RepID=A0A0E9TYG3_ANGAN